jgi:serine/threonine protein kinase
MVFFFLYDNGILHCDLFLDNILFHKNEDCMYIGTCDWGFAFRIDSPYTSKYNYRIVEEMKKEIKPSNFGWIPHYLLSMYKKK